MNPSSCPKCGQPSVINDECQMCGIIISKYKTRQNDAEAMRMEPYLPKKRPKMLEISKGIIVIIILFGMMVAFYSVRNSLTGSLAKNTNILHLLSLLFVICSFVLLIKIFSPKEARQGSKLQVFKTYGLVTVILFIVAYILTPNHGADPKKSAPQIDTKQQINVKKQSEKLRYRIENDEAYLDFKRTVKVILPERIDEELLSQIGKEIYGNRKKNFEKTFILYRIEGESTPTTWATTHFDPNIEVKIHGATKQQHERLLSQKHDDIPGLIGVWLCQYGPEYKMVVYKKGEMAVIRFINADDTSFEDQYEIIAFNGQIMLQNKREMSVGQYYKINTKGEMEYWNSNGNFYTAKPI